MKRILGTMLGLALAAPLAYGQTNVLSQNAVGYVKVNVPQAGLTLVRMDFRQLDTGANPTMGTIVGDQLPQNSKAHIWDPALNGGLGGYVSETKTRSGWPTPGKAIDQGMAFWLEAPLTAPLENPVYLMGEVPGANNNQETNSVIGNAGVAAVGYPYPAAVVWSNTTIAPVLPANSKLHLWNTVAQGYNSFTKTRSGWGLADSQVIEPGQAFWIETPGAFTWDEVKPYDWP